ncbi:3412_t:CDS:1, partial [Racocetra persica]
TCEGNLSNWDECKTQISKFPNARYKTFYDMKQAQSFIEGKEECAVEIDTNKLRVWTDGCSYENGSPNVRAGIGVFWGKG